MVQERNTELPAGFTRAAKELSVRELKGTFVTDHLSRTPVRVLEIFGYGFGFHALTFRCEVHEDVDGAPTTYAAPISALDTRPRNNATSLDHIGNATSDNHFTIFHPTDPKDTARNAWTWTGIRALTSTQAIAAGKQIDQRDFLADNLNRFPVFVTGDNNHYVPQTAIATKSGDPVNPLTIPYGALSNSLKINGRVELGDFGLAIDVDSGRSTPFIYGDAGGATSTSVGEYSRFLIRQLFPSGAASGRIAFIVFPGSGGHKRFAEPELMETVVKTMIPKLNFCTNKDEFLRFVSEPDVSFRVVAGDPELRLPQVFRSHDLIIGLALAQYGYGKLKPLPPNKMIF